VLQRPRNFTFQPYANGAGLVYLAFAEKEKVKAIKDAYPFFEFGAHLWKTEGELNQYLKKVRKSGTAVVPFETGKSLRVSAPVMDGSHKIAGVLGTSTPRILIKSKEQENKIINMTKQKASEIVQ
jgi:DNA-binding IclR family transcriptional regulator